jgi:hypothetical protein
MAVLNCAIYARDPTVWEGALKLLHEVQFDVVATTVPLSTRQAEWRKGALQARGDNPTAPALASLYSVPYIFMGNGSWAAGAVPVYVYLKLKDDGSEPEQLHPKYFRRWGLYADTRAHNLTMHRGDFDSKEAWAVYKNGYT